MEVAVQKQDNQESSSDERKHRPTNYLRDRDTYLKFKQAWSNSVNSKPTKYKLNRHIHALYAMLRGRDWTKGFTPASNKNKLENGYDPNFARNAALKELEKVFDPESLFYPTNGVERAFILKEVFGDFTTEEEVQRALQGAKKWLS